MLRLVGRCRVAKRRDVLFGADWAPSMLPTSLVPFGAILSKRTSFDWPGIGWWRLLLSIAIYLGLVWLHPFVLDVAAWPGLS